MIISKSIEILALCVQVGTEEATPDTNDALRLGIEALKRHQKALKGFANPQDYLLPGETLEDEK